MNLRNLPSYDRTRFRRFAMPGRRILWGVFLVLSSFLFWNCQSPVPSECTKDDDCFQSQRCLQGVCKASEEQTSPREPVETTTEHKKEVHQPEDGGTDNTPDQTPQDAPAPDTTQDASTDKTPEKEPGDGVSGKVKLLAIEGDGTSASIAYGSKQKPSKAKESSKRFRTHWVLKGENLDKLTGIKLVLKSDKSRVIKDLTLEAGDASMRKVKLSKSLFAGLFLIVGLVGTQEVALGQTFVLQGEGADKATLDFINKLKKFIKVDDAKKLVTVSGANFAINNGMGKTDSKNKLGNLIVGYNKIHPSNPLLRSGSHNLIVGDAHEYTSYGSFVAGYANRITGIYSSVTGGTGNRGTGKYAHVSGGLKNTASGESSNVSGGADNNALGTNSSVSGGNRNSAKGPNTSVTGGEGNTAEGGSSSVSGGQNNKTTGVFASVCAGLRNIAGGRASAVTGGADNKATNDNSSVSGGNRNVASGPNTSVSGGQGGNANGPSSSISGGDNNETKGLFSSVSGGVGNDATGKFASVGGGSNNTASGESSTVSGGSKNTASTANQHKP